VNVKIKGTTLPICFFDGKRITDCEYVLLKHGKPCILLKFKAFTVRQSFKDIKPLDGSADFESQ
jgi:hypothetical protein